MKCAKYIIVVLAVTAALATGASGQMQVSAQVDSGKDIYVGEAFNFYIVIQGSDNAGKVDLQPLRQYNPQSAGSRKQSSINIINNKTTRSVTTIMTYILTASQAGRIRLPSLTVEVGGEKYQTNPVAVNIIKPGTTDQLDLEVTLSQQQCYVGQPVIMMVKFYISANIGDFQFNIPAFSSDIFYIEEPDVSNPQAKLYRLNTGITVMVSQYRVVHKDKESILLSFSKVLIPKRSGKIAMQPASVSAAVAVGRTRSRDPFDSFFGGQTQYRRFMVTSDALELEVLPLPQQGKSAQFYGLVGQYTISASATPTKVNVGDPITLTVKIGGSKYLKPVQWPALEQLPALAANFKIPFQKASPAIDNGFKVFTQTIRANNDRVTEIPPIPLAYFDAEQGRYVTATTEPIKLEVAPTKILTNADLEGSGFAPINREIEAIMKGLSANYEALETLDDMSFSPLAALGSPGYAVLWAVPLLGLVSSFLLKLFSHTSPEKAAARRRRQACGKALGQLKKLRVEGVPPSNRGQDARDTIQQNELLVSIMKNYIGEKFDKTAGSLTPDECYDAIIAATEDAQSADEYRAIIAGFEAGHYAPMEIKIDSDKIREVSELVRSIEKNSKHCRFQNRKSKTGNQKYLIGLLLFCLAAPARSALRKESLGLPKEQVYSLFNQANQFFREANTTTNDPEKEKKLYEKAILNYEKIISDGRIKNSKLFYNLGNAYFLKEDIGRAILNYRRAQRLDKADTNIQKNLAFARSRRIDTVDVRTEKRILETLFFWHYDFSIKTKFLVTCICFAIVCISATVMLWRSTGRLTAGKSAPLVVTAVICGLLAASFLSSVVVESLSATNTICGVITDKQVVARQGDGPNYPESFKDPLHAGTEFDLLERRTGWFHIMLSDDSDGWIPDNAAELI